MNYKKQLFTLPVDMEDYRSPVSVITQEISRGLAKQTDDKVMYAVESQLGVSVDKGELLKAMQYDRDQFEAGYRAALKERTCMVTDEGSDMIYTGNWYRCSSCGYMDNTTIAKFCGGCGRVIFKNCI